MLPGALSWGTLLTIVLLSIYAPSAAAYFIIAFSLYWLLKTIYLSLHLRHNWKRLLHNLNVNWTKRLENIKHDHLWHMIILPFYKEPLETVERSIKALVEAKGDKERMIVVLAAEERAGKGAQRILKMLERRYAKKFKHLLLTTHPENVPGEMPGKGSNIAYAAEQSRVSILDKHSIDYKDVVVSAFDVDTVVYPQYFQCLSWYFLTAEDPHHTSFQPVPLYNNNIWEAPAISRVVAVSSTFWQMIQQERPEKLATFSSHSVSFFSLHRAGYWQRNMVNEDSRIFWNLFFANEGKYQVLPMAYPVSMDANLAPSIFRTLVNIYKQHRRWTWGVENVPYIIYQGIKHKTIPLKKANLRCRSTDRGFLVTGNSSAHPFPSRVASDIAWQSGIPRDRTLIQSTFRSAQHTNTCDGGALALSDNIPLTSSSTAKAVPKEEVYVHGTAMALYSNDDDCLQRNPRT